MGIASSYLALGLIGWAAVSASRKTEMSLLREAEIRQNLDAVPDVSGYEDPANAVVDPQNYRSDPTYMANWRSEVGQFGCPRQLRADNSRFIVPVYGDIPALDTF